MAISKKETWTDLRKAHFGYFKKNLSWGGDDRSKKLVDLGAGQVPFREIFFKYDYEGLDFKKFEVDPKLADIIKEADITKPLDLPDNYCDIVTLSNVLEHIPSPGDVIKECFRILKPGGMVIGAVPFLVRLHQEPYDFHRYTNYALKYYLESAGFKDIKVENIGQPFYVYKEAQDYFFDIFLRGKPRGIAKCFWILFAKFALWQTRFFSRALARTPPDDSFPAGYGFKGIKAR